MLILIVLACPPRLQETKHDRYNQAAGCDLPETAPNMLLDKGHLRETFWQEVAGTRSGVMGGLAPAGRVGGRQAPK